MKEKIIPSPISLPLSTFNSGDREDERRLLYVAMTRAKKECHISSYIINEQGKEKNVSTLIPDISEMEHVDMSQWEQQHMHEIVDFFAEGNEHIVSLLDRDYITNLFFSKPLSVSALNNYIQSPLKYFFRNLVALPEARNHFLDFGNFIHTVLEKYFDYAVKNLEIPGTDMLKRIFQEVLASNPYYVEFENRGWNILEAYVEHYHNEFVIPTFNEKRISGISFGNFGDHELLLSGVIDKITRNEDGTFTVWDYKTGRTYSDMSDKARRANIKRQATFYKLLLQDAFGGQYNFNRAVFDFVEPNTKGEYEQKIFEITDDDVKTLCEEIKQLVQDVLDGTLLKKDFTSNTENEDLLSFLEVMKGEVVQRSLLE